MTRRVFDPRQQGARLGWHDTLFQLVDPAEPPPRDFFPTTEPMPLIVTEVDMHEFELAMLAQAARDGL